MGTELTNVLRSRGQNVSTTEQSKYLRCVVEQWKEKELLEMYRLMLMENLVTQENQLRVYLRYWFLLHGTPDCGELSWANDLPWNEPIRSSEILRDGRF